jgi:hypothetical protein
MSGTLYFHRSVPRPVSLVPLSPCEPVRVAMAEAPPSKGAACANVTLRVDSGHAKEAEP